MAGPQNKPSAKTPSPKKTSPKTYLERVADLVEPVPEAAVRLGVSPQYVRQLIAAGRLEAVRIGRHRFVSRLSVLEFLQARRSRRASPPGPNPPGGRRG